MDDPIVRWPAMGGMPVLVQWSIATVPLLHLTAILGVLMAIPVTGWDHCVGWKRSLIIDLISTRFESLAIPLQIVEFTPFCGLSPSDIDSVPFMVQYIACFPFLWTYCVNPYWTILWLQNRWNIQRHFHFFEKRIRWSFRVRDQIGSVTAIHWKYLLWIRSCITLHHWFNVLFFMIIVALMACICGRRKYRLFARKQKDSGKRIERTDYESCQWWGGGTGKRYCTVSTVKFVEIW